MLTSADNGLWLAMWKNRQTDFHQVLVNQQLQDHWHRLAIPAWGRVLVPLCGKSNDLIWLAEKGFQVVGIELSSVAVRAFFDENKLKPKKTRLGNFTVWRHGRISIFCGDIFLLKSASLGLIDAVYDRAALTALPEKNQEGLCHQVTFIHAVIETHVVINDRRCRSHEKSGFRRINRP